LPDSFAGCPPIEVETRPTLHDAGTMTALHRIVLRLMNRCGAYPAHIDAGDAPAGPSRSPARSRVQTYSDAYLTGDANTAYGSLSALRREPTAPSEFPAPSPRQSRPMEARYHSRRAGLPLGSGGEGRPVDRRHVAAVHPLRLGQARTAPEIAGAFLNLEPVVGVVLAVVAFNDSVGVSWVAGAAPILPASP
jgi:hypothetical protein